MSKESVIKKIADLDFSNAEAWAAMGSCIMDGVAFIANALLSGIITQGLTKLLTRVEKEPDLSDEELIAHLEDLESQIEEEHWRALQENIKQIRREALGLDDDALADRLLAYLHRDAPAHEKLSDEMHAMLAALPFPVFLSVGQLVEGLPRISEIGLQNVVDRPESDAILAAFAGKTRQLMVTGKALSGKSFLGFKVAQKWIQQGGAVAWMQSPTLTSINVQAMNQGRKPLLVWDPVEPAALDENAFSQLRQFTGHVLINTRVGDRSPAKQAAEQRLKQLLPGFGFAEAAWKNGRLATSARLAYVFLGPMADAGEVVSRNARGRYPGFFTITNDGKEALSTIMNATRGEQKTTILGLGTACLMALHKKGEQQVTGEAVASLLSARAAGLTQEDIVQEIFSQTVNDQDRRALRVLERLRHWTGQPVVHEIILRLALTAQGLDEAGHALTDLEKGGILVRLGEYLAVWHDMQLDVLGEEDSQAQRNQALDDTATALAREVEANKDTSKLANLCTAAGNFANQINDLGHWAQSLHIYESLNNAFRNLAQPDPATYKPLVATNCNNLGLLLADMGQRKPARGLYQEALKTYRDLAKEQPQAYLPDVAM
ncbi:MAG: tetratricopeptide repeat protein, partial [Desulfarculaceae bacterium]